MYFICHTPVSVPNYLVRTVLHNVTVLQFRRYLKLSKLEKKDSSTQFTFKLFYAYTKTLPKVRDCIELDPCKCVYLVSYGDETSVRHVPESWSVMTSTPQKSFSEKLFTFVRINFM